MVDGRTSVAATTDPAVLPAPSMLKSAVDPGDAAGWRCVICRGTRWRSRFRKQGYDFVRCSDCGLMRLDPIPSADLLARHYAERADGGNYDPGKAEERRAASDGMFAFLGRRIGPGKRRILDIGCFDGQLLDAAQRAGWEGWGVEMQRHAAERARRRHGGRIFVGPLEDYELPLPGGFDVVAATGVIEHLRDPGYLVELAVAAMKPGGYLLIQTPDAASFPARVMGRYWPCIAAPEHIFYFSHTNLRRLCEASGLVVVTRRPHWKRLRIGYAIDQLRYFGEELGRFAIRAAPLLPPALLNVRLPLYGGEMLLLARKPPASNGSD